MARVYPVVDGKKIVEFIAEDPGVHGHIATVTAHYGVRARALKAKHVDQGHAFVETELGETDGWVILNDNRGKKAAMAMEYGSAPHKGWPDGTDPQAILHEATGLPMKLTMPRSRRIKKWAMPRRRRKRK